MDMKLEMDMKMEMGCGGKQIPRKSTYISVSILAQVGNIGAMPSLALPQHSAWRQEAEVGTDASPLYAYVCLYFGDSVEVLIGLMVVGWALKVQFPTKHDVLLMHTSDVPAKYLSILAIYFELVLVEDILLPHLVTPESRPQLQRLFAKLRMLELVKFRKVLFIDGDVLIRAPLDEIFDADAPAAVPVGYNGFLRFEHGEHLSMDHFLHHPEDDELQVRMNAGIVLLAPCKETFEALLLAARERRVHSHCPEEELLTWYFAGSSGKSQWHALDVMWNLEIHESQKCNVSEQDIVAAKVFHYSCSWCKPWWIFRECAKHYCDPWQDWIAELSRVWLRSQAWYTPAKDPQDLAARSWSEWAEAFSTCMAGSRHVHDDIFKIITVPVVIETISVMRPCSFCYQRTEVYPGRGSYGHEVFCDRCWTTWFRTWSLPSERRVDGWRKPFRRKGFVVAQETAVRKQEDLKRCRLSQKSWVGTTAVCWCALCG
jgi:hypothetical protein